MKFRRAPFGRVVMLYPMLPRRLETLIPGDASRFVPLNGPITTEDAGELPGVLMTLPALVPDLSIETMLDMESRSCWCLFICISSRARSMSFISTLILSHRALVSNCNRRISPFTVKRSVTPFSIMDKTLSIAGP